MKIGIMQPYLFPYIGYFQLIAAVDKFIVLDDVNFIKKGWINRNQILINGNASFFNIPLNKISQNRLISDHNINNSIPWQNKLLRSIELNYKRAPYFSQSFPLISELIVQNEEKISLFNFNSLKKVSSFLGLETQFYMSSDNNEHSALKGEQKILNICQQYETTHYINLPGGKSLYSNESFSSAGIKLSFIDSDSKFSYPQFKSTFVPNLSIIDVLMFNPTADIRKMISK